MEISARECPTAAEEEFITKIIKFVYAQMDKLGMELHALSDSHAAVENNGTIQAYNVIALQDLIGMVEHAFSVLMVRYGIHQQDNVSARLVLNGIINFVLSFKTAKEEQFGIKILGHANAPQQQFGTIFIVWQILVLEDKFGTISLRLVSVWVTRYL